MKVSEASRICQVADNLNSVLVGKMGATCDAVKAADRETPKCYDGAAPDRYRDGVQDTFTAFLKMLSELTVEDIQAISGKTV